MPNESPAGQRFAYWLAQAAKKTREDANAIESDVASALGVGGERITRFEKAENWPRGDGTLERTIAAYAKVARLDDPLDIFRLALKMWAEHGTYPELARREASPAEEFPKTIAPQAPEGDAGAPARSSSAKRKRKAS